ncbi:hypothetical protein CRUP_006565, partial [Coryphaenoides rupestris]
MGVDCHPVDGRPAGGQIAGIASAIGVAIMGAASGYFAYQKKKTLLQAAGGLLRRSPPSDRITSQSEAEQPQNCPDEAFVTLATTDGYCMGAAVVARSLRRHG